MGYHKKEIGKGKYGDFSKIQEEFDELCDAREQQCSILELCELSDLLGAIEGYIENRFKITISDLKKFSDLTKEAFIEGSRK